MSVLVNCGKYVVFRIVQEWLTIEDICLFDSALCNNSLRQKYQSCLNSHAQEIRIKGAGGNNLSDDILLWLLNKNLSTEHTFLNKKSLSLLSELEANMGYKLITFYGLDMDDIMLMDLFEKLIEKCPALTDITIISGENIQYSYLTSKVGLLCPGLKTVDFILCRGSPGEGNLNDSNTSFYSGLESVKFQWCLWVSDDIISSLPTECPNIKTFVYEPGEKSPCGPHSITASSLHNIIGNCPNLTVLDVETCDSVDSNLLISLTRKCPLITDLTLHRDYEVTEAVLEAVADNLCDLKKLVICGALSGSLGLVQICLKCPFLEELSVNYLLSFHNTVNLRVLLKDRSVSGLEYKKVSSTDTQDYVLINGKSTLMNLIITIPPPPPLLTDNNQNNSQSSHVSDNNYQTVTAETTTSSMCERSVNSNKLYNALSKCKNLRKVSSQIITRESEILTNHTPYCADLVTLDLEGCYSICTDDLLLGFSTVCHKLELINLKDCFHISDVGLIPLLEANPRLTALNVYQCRRVNDVTITALATHCHELLTLNLTYCTNITDTAIIALSQGCSELREVVLDSCLLVSDVAIAALKQNCPQIKTIFTKNTKTKRDVYKRWS